MLTSRRWLHRLAVLAALALVVGACGNGDPVADDPTPPPDGDGVFVVTAVDYDFPDLPSSLAVGTQIEIDNQSEAEIHEVVAIRLNDDETRPVGEIVQLPPDEMMGAGDLVGVTLQFPDGEVVEPYGPVVLEEAGRYAFLCFIPEGADPDEFRAAMAEAEEGPPDVEGGPPHVAFGMYAEVNVS